MLTYQSTPDFEQRKLPAVLASRRTPDLGSLRGTLDSRRDADISGKTKGHGSYVRTLVGVPSPLFMALPSITLTVAHIMSIQRLAMYAEGI